MKTSERPRCGLCWRRLALKALDTFSSNIVKDHYSHLVYQNMPKVKNKREFLHISVPGVPRSCKRMMK